MRTTGTIAAALGFAMLTLAAGPAALAVGGSGKAPAPPAAAPAPPSEAARRGRELLEAGRVEDAEKALRDALAAKPDDAEARLVLGEVLDWDGRPDEADACWREGLAGKDADVPLLRATARLHLRRAADGPLVTRRRGARSMPFGEEAKDAEGFARTQREAALESLRKAAALRPADRDVAFDLASLLSNLRKYDEALKAWEALAKKDPKNAAVLVGWGEALLGAGKRDDAKARLDQALKIAPRSPDAHFGLAEVLKAAGKAPESEAERRKAELYSWLPPFSKLEFSEPLYGKARTLAVDPFWNSKDGADAKRMWDEKRAIVDAAVAAKDDASWQLLEAVCWNHCAHGPIEDGAFAALEARGKPSLPALLAMLREGDATCTVGAAARALARMKEASAFDLMVARLPKDVHPVFPMDIAGALVLLGDPRAVPHLVRAMDVDAPPAPKPKPEERKGKGITVVIGGPEEVGGEAGLDGRPAARYRAALAAGEFDVPEARAALERGCGNPEIAGVCHAVLWRLTKDEKAHGRAVAAVMNGEDGVAKFLVGEYLPRIDHPSAKALHDAWVKEREEREKAGK